jgi:hypothetical protein
MGISKQGDAWRRLAGDGPESSDPSCELFGRDFKLNENFGGAKKYFIETAGWPHGPTKLELITLPVVKRSQLGGNMKRSLLFVCIGLLAATTASAQDPPAQSGPNNNAVNTPGQNNSNAPVAGSNSFTEGQAKSKIEAAGFGNVTELKKDEKGIWRGKASKGGSATSVSLDFQGNVNTTN